MAQAAALDIQQYQGDDWDDAFLIQDSGVSRNLTGYTARMYIKTAIGAADPPALALTTTNGRLVVRTGQTGVGAGYIDMVVPNSVTAAMSPGRYFYDLEIINAANKVKKFASGTFTVVQEVTTGT